MKRRSCHWRLRPHRWQRVVEANWSGFRVLEHCEVCGRFSIADKARPGLFIMDRFRKRASDSEAWRLIDRKTKQ